MRGDRTAPPPRARSIVFASADYWTTALPMCSHQLARALARAGWSVAFVSGPITPFHFVPGAAPGMRARFDLWRRRGARELDGRLWAFLPGSLIAPTNKRGMRGDWVLRHWWRFAVPPVMPSLARAGFGSPDVLCFEAPTHAYLLRALPHRRSVLRVVDQLSVFPGHGAARERALRRLAADVDLVTYTAGSLHGYVEGLAPRRSALLANGVDFEHFVTPQPEPEEYAALPRPRAVYAGNLAEWFDFGLLDEVAARLPEVSFVLIGPTALACRRLHRRPNLHLLGVRPFARLPAYLQHADAGLIPFDVVRHPELINAVNPLKLHEYLACGLPVVATDWDELRALASSAFLATGPEAFAGALQRALAAPPDPAAARRFAAARDWAAVAQRFVELLQLE